MLIMRFSLLVLSVITMAACTSIQPKYDRHDSRFVGTWYGKPYPFVTWGFNGKTYFPNGAACGYIVDVDKSGRLELVVYKSRWAVKNGQLLSTVLESNSEFLRSSPKPIVDDIVSINAHTMRLHSQDDPKGKTYENHKLEIDRGDSICKLFDVVTKQGVQIESPD